MLFKRVTCVTSVALLLPLPILSVIEVLRKTETRLHILQLIFVTLVQLQNVLFFVFLWLIM